MSRQSLPSKAKLRAQIKRCKDAARRAGQAGNTKLNPQYTMQMVHLQELLAECGNWYEP